MSYPDNIFYKNNKKNIYDLIDKLPSSSTMEETGDVFNPKYILLDDRTKIAYRKEVFQCGSLLPDELLIRDRRFSKNEIASLCEKLGIEIQICGFVKAGNFKMAADPDNNPTREILVVGRKQLI